MSGRTVYPHNRVPDDLDPKVRALCRAVQNREDHLHRGGLHQSKQGISFRNDVKKAMRELGAPFWWDLEAKCDER